MRLCGGCFELLWCTRIGFEVRKFDVWYEQCGFLLLVSGELSYETLGSFYMIYCGMNYDEAYFVCPFCIVRLQTCELFGENFLVGTSNGVTRIRIVFGTIQLNLVFLL